MSNVSPKAYDQLLFVVTAGQNSSKNAGFQFQRARQRGRAQSAGEASPAVAWSPPNRSATRQMMLLAGETAEIDGGPLDDTS
jgi:hypothetical protein